MNKLFIDTSTKALILAVEQNNKITNFLFDLTNNDHSERLMSEIESLFDELSINIQDIDEFYVCEGPGSYTGVRIGVTVAKMFAYTLEKPLHTVSSLSVIASPYINKASYIIPIIDARRNNVFSTIYKVDQNELVQVADEKLYNIEELIDMIKPKINDQLIFVGLDTENFKDTLDNHSFKFYSNLKADFVKENIFSKINFKKVNDIHQISPNYRRETEAERNLSKNG